MPLLSGHLIDTAPGERHGVVHQYIQPTVFFGRGAQRTYKALFVADIYLYRFGLAAAGTDTINNRFKRLHSATADHHTRTFLRKTFCRGGTDATATTGNKCDFAL
jgi:hypothetical protein